MPKPKSRAKSKGEAPSAASLSTEAFIGLARTIALSMLERMKTLKRSPTQEVAQRIQALQAILSKMKRAPS